MFWDMLSTFVSVVGNLNEGNSQARAAQYNKQVNLYNANQTREVGYIEADKVRREGRQAAARIQANVGASGFSMDGSAMDVLAQSAYNSEYDALATMYTYEAKATENEMNAKLQGAKATDARNAGYFNAASSVLRGATKVWGKNEIDKGVGSSFSLGSIF